MQKRKSVRVKSTTQENGAYLVTWHVVLCDLLVKETTCISSGSLTSTVILEIQSIQCDFLLCWDDLGLTA